MLRVPLFVKNSISPNKSAYQAKLHATKHPQILICTGPAGSGKTMEACKAAITHIEQNHFKKLIITRPSITVEEDLGYLPGDIQQKMNPSMIPIYEYLDEFSSRHVIDKYIKDGVVELVPLGFTRGRTFESTIVIADEMQNCTKKQMLTLLTRIGHYSKIIITGDPDQCDIPKRESGLIDLITKFNIYYNTLDADSPIHSAPAEEKSIDLVNLTSVDIKRSDVVKEVLNLYNLL